MQIVAIMKMYIIKVFSIGHYPNNLLIHMFSLAVTMLINDISIEIVIILYCFIFMWTLLLGYFKQVFSKFLSSIYISNRLTFANYSP